eukprot:TRINITY_DN42551_c0_g1_i3.p2 TRINITY_DN42551_c0_g1~~TRINITY_DN42551_c0_g1_i3.p2  ORF type:complete len:116 (-),score=5.21 TRINITY_DN42551_c0_g1_i3:43-390(-)
MQREMQENTQILDSVAMADADIFDSIVEDAFAFACRLLRSVSRALQTEDGDEDLDLRQLQSVESPTQFLLTIEERMSDLNSSGKHKPAPASVDGQELPYSSQFASRRYPTRFSKR